MKRCSKCSQDKDESEFGIQKRKGRKDALKSWCQVCCRAATAAWQKSDKGKRALSAYRTTDKFREFNREWQRKYRQTENGKAAYRRVSAGEKGKARSARHRETDKYKERHRQDSANYRKRHPEIAKAHNAVLWAVKNGTLADPETLQCSRCPNTAKHYHHHKGYAPEHHLDVVPLCIECHTKEHYPHLA